MSRQTTTCASHPSKPPASHRLRLRLRSAVRRIGLLGTASLLALVLPWSAARADIVIGQVAPLSGVLASTGKQMVLGGSIYFRHVNAQGGVHGQKIAVKVLDDGYKVDDTVRLTRELLADPELVALFGFAGTSNVGKLLSEGVLEQGGAALVAPYTGGEPLRNPFNPWIFHVRAGYADETEHMVQQVTTLGMTRIAVMYQDDGFGKAGLEGVQKALTRRKLELSAAAPYDRRVDPLTGEAAVIVAKRQARPNLGEGVHSHVPGPAPDPVPGK